MVLRWFYRHPLLHPLPPFILSHRACLVNIKLKWVKDRTLDSIVSRDRHLRQTLTLLDLIASNPHTPTFTPSLSHHRRQLGLHNLTVAAFLRRFPLLFIESRNPSGPSFHLTAAALRLREEELQILSTTEQDLIDRLSRLLMLTIDRSLPLHTIDQLRWDMGFPIGYHETLIPRYPDLFELFHPPEDERVWLRLLSWDPSLAVSELEKSYGGNAGECLVFPVSFARGFGLKRKCLLWLQEWQTLPYTSPYVDAGGLDPRTDVSEKRIVGVFHELLHLMIGKKTERRNVSNLRRALMLPQKFTKVFERHPGIFYLSQKLATQTVVLREAYGGGRELLNKHPLLCVREKYAAMMRAGLPERRRRRSSRERMENAILNAEEEDESDGFDSCQEGSCSDSNSFTEGDSEGAMNDPYS